MAKSKRRSGKKVEKKEDKEDAINYAKTADKFADEGDDDDEIPSEEENENPNNSDQDDSSDDGDDGEDSDNNDDDDDDDEEVQDDDDDDGEEEEEEGNVVNALFKGPSGTDDSDQDSGSDDDDDGNNTGKRVEATSGSKLVGPEQCNFDLRNLTAMNSHQIPSSSLYSTKKVAGEETICIPLDQGHDLRVNEDYLLDRASSACAQLIAAIWQLPTEMSDAGPLATLPGYNEIAIPRAMPPPPPKEETKWEKFAKAKGIPLNKEKRSRKVWDEATGTWMYRHGHEKANSSSKEWPIMEVGANDDPFDDPWEKVRDSKRARTEKNLENRMKNQERVGNLAKGTTNRVLKSREKSRKEGKLAGNADRDDVPPTGVPVDLKGEGGTAKLRGKVSTVAALEAVQRSTASLGKFDKVLEGEPERKKTLSKLKKRKYESATDKKVITTEGQKSMKILDAVINGGGVAKEKAIRKGQYATGETAYDYEFNDGLGASTFKKKKGRAGAGKMKKMTKKRAK